jgi:serine/threonine protein kinase
MNPTELDAAKEPEGRAAQADTTDLRGADAVTGGHASRPATEMVGAIWEEMRAAWNAGKPLKAEQFLTKEFLEECGDEGAVDVIYGEFALAETHGAKPQVNDYLRRFPQFQPGLERQFSLHAAIELMPSGATEAQDGAPTITDGLACPGPFGKYMLVAPLDAGGQSRVYRAVHPDLGKEVVLKLARPSETSADLHNAAALAAEAKLLADLKHPNLAQIHDAGVIDGRRYLAIEYIRGRTLAQHARQAQLTPQQAAAIVAKTARALAVVHAHGILHLDIKPKNIVIDEQGEPRLIDFGLSRHEHAWSEPREVEGLAGTLEFMAPEQARCEPNTLGPAADIFSLGGVLYYLLTGNALFAARTARESLKLAKENNWDRTPLALPAIPAAIRRCCEKALATKPAERFASASDFAAELDRSIARRGVPTYALAGAAVIAIMVIAFLAGSWFSGPTPPPAVVASPKLEIQVWQQDIRKELTHAVPLINGDELRAEGEAPARNAAILLLINSAGELSVLQDYPATDSAQLLVYPNARSRAPLTGNPGSEGLFLITGTKLPTADDLNTWWRSTDTHWPALPEYTVLRITAAAVTTESGGRDLGDPVRKIDPEGEVRNRLEDFRQILSRHGLQCNGLVFPHAR